jgi:L-fuconolactonase
MPFTNMSDQTAPDVPEIIDAHVHIVLGHQERYDLADLARDMSSVPNLKKAIFVQTIHNQSLYDGTQPAPLASLAETELIATKIGAAEATGQPNPIAGIICFIDMFLAERAGPVGESHIDAGRGYVRGVRHSASWDADPDISSYGLPQAPGMLLEPTFQRGISAIASLGLVFDVMVWHPQLEDVIKTARALPSVTFSINHMGGPLGIGGYAESSRAEWRRDLGRLAELPNVMVKLGGLGIAEFGALPSGGIRASREAIVAKWQDAVRFVIDTFGPARCMFESDFPRDRPFADYNNLWAAYQRIASQYSYEERCDLFAGVARRVYKLEAA